MFISGLFGKRRVEICKTENHLIAQDICVLPVQVNPSPVNPALQVHILVPPITLVHRALTEHPPLLLEHSFISKDQKDMGNQIMLN